MFLTVVVCVAVIGLVITNSVTEDKIEEARMEALKEILIIQFPDMDNFEYNEDIEIYTIYDKEQEIIGYAFETQADGYGGEIELLVALEKTDMTEGNIMVKGISVLSHGETPGLGAKIEESTFLNQFKGTNIDDIRLAAAGGEIDAISGATVSSKAVVSTVHESVLEKAALIRENTEVSA
ncbi:MAG: RnfABCDGE type electron transport complex subunit G [Thermoplasmata archaeon]